VTVKANGFSAAQETLVCRDCLVVEVVSRKPVSGPDRRKQENNREFRENRCLEPRPAVEFSGKASMLRPNSLAEDNRELDKSDQGRKHFSSLTLGIKRASHLVARDQAGGLSQARRRAGP
jgi:hypothetical protein